MPVDPSIALQGQPLKLPNPLEMAVQGASLRNQTLEGNNLQKTIAANQAVSQAIQHNTDANGNFNAAGAQAELSRNPDAGYNLQAATGANLQQQGQQISNATNQYNLTGAHMGYMAQEAASLLASKDPNALSPDNVKASINQWGKTVGIPQSEVNNYIAQVPTDPKQVKGFIYGALGRAISAEAQLNAATPGGASVDSGPNVAITNKSPLSGLEVGTPVAVYNKSFTPGEGSTPTTVGVNAQGAPITGTRQQFVDKANATGGVQTAPSQFQTAEQGNAASYENDLNVRTRAAQQSEHYITEAQQLMKDAPNLAGGGANFRADMARRAQGLGLPDNIVDGISKGNLGDTQVLGKILMQNAIQQMQTNFTGTGAASNVDMFMHNNPNLENDPRAIPKLFNFMEGMNGNIGKEQQAYRDFVNKGGNPVDFPAKWNSSTTMRAFTGKITPVRTGTVNGRKVVQYSDGSVDYQ